MDKLTVNLSRAEEGVFQVKITPEANKYLIATKDMNIFFAIANAAKDHGFKNIKYSDIAKACDGECRIIYKDEKLISNFIAYSSNESTLGILLTFIKIKESLVLE
jgi:hypothetical protein